MKNLKPLIEKLKKYDFVGSGCHYKNCTKTGYPKPSNGVMVSRSIDKADYLIDNKKDIKHFYFKLGRENMWDNINYLKKNKGWDYYHYDSRCLERDSNDNKLRNHRFISNENIDKKCKNDFLYIPVYNTAPGFPEWFKNLSENQLLKSNMLISKLFRQALKKKN